ncbi:hypothetical protein ACHAWF_018138 [Thalassiosira exigua]
MPRNQGTSRKGKPKKEMRSAGFGKALQRSQTKRYVPKSNGSSAHGQGMMATGARTVGVAEEGEGAKMKSVLEMDDLGDFLLQAQLADRDFRSEREQFLDVDAAATEYVPTGQASTAVIHEDVRSSRPASGTRFAFRELGVPRRPAWIPGVTTPEELEASENESFLEWRRGVARKEEEIAAAAFRAAGGGGTAGVASASVTPYERNLHVWRQLWRVLERSAVVLQIVDARNPLFYYSEDLRAYAADELGKPVLVLVNKSDYLTEGQRRAWSGYFEERGIDHLFFSAHNEQKKIDEEIAAAKRGEALGRTSEKASAEEGGKVVSDDEGDSDLGEGEASQERPTSSDPSEDSAAVDEDGGPSHPTEGTHAEATKTARSDRDDLLLGVSEPLTREQLLTALDAFARGHGCTPDEKYDNRIQYGLVGFPNGERPRTLELEKWAATSCVRILARAFLAVVLRLLGRLQLAFPSANSARSSPIFPTSPAHPVGKSSVINVLVGSSKSLHGVVRAAVAAQPGKTKHFQTLLLPDRDDAMLCDCPGLVFPSFVSSTADAIAAGVYPIAQMRDHWPVVNLICARCPREVLEARYGMKLPVPSEAELREMGWSDASRLPPPTAEELLGTYCEARSMLSAASGVPDYQRASRVIVRDYAEGKLLYCHAPPRDGSSDGMEEKDYHRETLKTAVRNTSNEKKLRKLEQSLEAAEAAAEKSAQVMDDEDILDDFDSILGDMDDDRPNGEKRGKAHKTIKQWGKKGRKLRNKDPYGCHSDPDSVLQTSDFGSGAIVNAGKYGGSYTRANYAGAKAATPFEGRADRPKKGRRHKS